MLLNRDEFVLALFRETDRAQRMKTQLSLIYFGIEEAESRFWQTNTDGFENAIDEIVGRIVQTLRSYDSVTRMAPGEFAMLLPGCTSSNAMALAQRLNQEQFAAPVVVEGSEIQLAWCFGVTTSRGRSALVVLREAEQSFRKAKARDSGSISRSATASEADPTGFSDSDAPESTIAK
jgi:diguanylate cyclase (GGDEF)-like protein